MVSALDADHVGLRHGRARFLYLRLPWYPFRTNVLAISCACVFLSSHFSRVEKDRFHDPLVHLFTLCGAAGRHAFYSSIRPAGHISQKDQYRNRLRVPISLHIHGRSALAVGAARLARKLACSWYRIIRSPFPRECCAFEIWRRHHIFHAEYTVA